eukprot:138758-Prorocentrum_minimum.AAC.1
MEGISTSTAQSVARCRSISVTCNCNIPSPITDAESGTRHQTGNPHHPPHRIGRTGTAPPPLPLFPPPSPRACSDSLGVCISTRTGRVPNALSALRRCIQGTVAGALLGGLWSHFGGLEWCTVCDDSGKGSLRDGGEASTPLQQTRQTSVT